MNTFLLIIVIIISINVILHLYYKHITDNKGVPQLSMIDKAKLLYKYGLIIKIGVLLSRDSDKKWFGFLLNGDDLMIKYHRDLKTRYKKAAILDMIHKKFYYITDENLAEKILKSDDLYVSGWSKEIVFKNIMPTNLGVSCGKLRKEKRHFNEKLFGTQRISGIFNSVGPAIENALSTKPVKYEDFNEIAHLIISKLYLGDSSNETLDILSKYDDYIKMDSNLGIRSTINRIFPAKEAKENLRKKIESVNPDENDNLMFYVKGYSKTYSNKCEKDIIHEIPHWYIPLRETSTHMIPHLLHTILSFHDVYDNLMNEINSKHFNIHSRRSYLHYCVIEHLNSLDIVNPQRILFKFH